MRNLIILFFIFQVFSLASFAQEEKKPIFLTVTSKFCETCKKLNPLVEELQYEYYGKLDFITLDISTKDSIEESKKLAEEKGLTNEFEKYKSRIPQVLVLCKPGTVKENFFGETDKEKYQKALDNIIQSMNCNL